MDAQPSWAIDHRRTETGVKYRTDAERLAIHEDAVIRYRRTGFYTPLGPQCASISARAAAGLRRVFRIRRAAR